MFKCLLRKKRQDSSVLYNMKGNSTTETQTYLITPLSCPIHHKFIICNFIKCYILCSWSMNSWWEQFSLFTLFCFQNSIFYYLYQMLVTQLCLTLCNRKNCSQSGSSIHRILQAKTLKWAAFPSPGDLPDPGVKPESPALQVDSSPSELQGKPS